MRRFDSPWLAAALELLLPDRCLGCGGGRAARRAPCGLCLPCFARLRRPSRTACRCCAVPLPGAEGIARPLCGPCRLDPPPVERLWAVWEYGPPLDRVLRALKFRQLDYLGGELAAAAFAYLGPELAGAELVVPVPLHWRRRWHRGYNQAERIARPLARRLDRPFSQPLTRARATRAQAMLSRRERLRGPRGAFRTADPRPVAHRRILLVDDVTTTGATLRAAASAILAAGARSVDALAIAVAPPPGGDRGTVSGGWGNSLHPLDG